MALNYICVFCGQKSGMPASRCCNSQNGRFFNANRCQFIANNPAQKEFFCRFCGKRFPSILAMVNTPCPKSPSKRCVPLEAKL